MADQRRPMSGSRRAVSVDSRPGPGVDPRRGRPNPTKRNRLIAAIHAEAKRRGISDDDRRELQRIAVGVESCADMTPAQLGRVLTLVTRRRLRDVSRPRDDLAGMRRRAVALAADFGAGEKYVDAIARRQCGRPLRECDAGQLRGVIAACYTARRRRGGDAARDRA